MKNRLFLVSFAVLFVALFAKPAFCKSSMACNDDAPFFAPYESEPDLVSVVRTFDAALTCNCEMINKIIDALDVYKAVTVAIPLVDTLLRVNKRNFIIDIPKRSHFRREQTPQGFDYQTIKKAHCLAVKENFYEATDDCVLVKKYKLSDVFVIQGEEENMKITYPIDLLIAKKLFQIKNLG